MRTQIRSRTATAVAAAVAVTSNASFLSCTSAFVPPTASSSRPTRDIDNLIKSGGGPRSYLDSTKLQEGGFEEFDSPKPHTSVSVSVDFDIDRQADAVKKNVLEGEFGKRGEQYVLAQFGLLLCIALGTVPFIGDVLTLTLGPGLIGASLVIVYKSAADLGTNLSPWPVPADPASGNGSLIDMGIYSYMRHPMYSGLLFGMAGLSVTTDSTMRLLLTAVLYFVLDAKSDYEETKLIETYGAEYEHYMCAVGGKFVPDAVLSWFKK